MRVLHCLSPLVVLLAIFVSQGYSNGECPDTTFYKLCFNVLEHDCSKYSEVKTLAEKANCDEIFKTTASFTNILCPIERESTKQKFWSQCDAYLKALERYHKGKYEKLKAQYKNGEESEEYK